MSPAPWFAAGPGALWAMFGHWGEADTTVPTPADDWRHAVVDVVVPVCRHHDTIIHCLSSLLAQTRLPRRVLLVDDGGVDRDHTLQLAREFARANGIKLETIARGWSVGRVVTLKRQAREFEGDVLLVLDANTALESPDYIERCVRELYQGVGIASATGRVLPLQAHSRKAMESLPSFRHWQGDDVYADPVAAAGHWQARATALADDYRSHLARLQQDFLDAGLMRAHGGVPIGTGGAVAYRRRYLRDLFHRYEPIRGDDLTHLENHFIAMALMTAGYRNIRVPDVVARSRYPGLTQLPADARRWSAAFLQVEHYFDVLLRSPLRRWLRAWRVHRRRQRGAELPVGQDAGRRDARRIAEAYRQGFGERITRQHGRPLGIALALIALERIGYPVLLWVLVILGQWPLLAVIVGMETAVTCAIASRFARERRGMAALQTLAWTPLRYLLILQEPLAMGWFAVRLWGRRELGWHVRRDPQGRRRPIRH